MAPINILGAYTRTGRIHREKTLGETNVNRLPWPNNVEFNNRKFLVSTCYPGAIHAQGIWMQSHPC